MADIIRLDDKLMQAKNRVHNFINDCLKHKHYQHADFNPPAEYLNWRDDKPQIRKFADWIRNNANLPSLRIDIPCPYKEIAVEANQLDEQYVKHRYNMHPGWDSICIHGAGATITNDWKAQEYKHLFTEEPEYKYTEIADICPITTEWLKDTFPYREYKRVRFMMLRPGGFIQPHQDVPERCLAAHNVAITNPPGVIFAQEDAGQIPWEEGDCRQIDIGRPHCVLNTSQENRIHMIVHGSPRDEFVIKLIEAYELLRDNQQT